MSLGWNYRLVYHPPSTYMVGETEFDRDEYLAIHEVYYDDDGKPNSMTIDEIVTGDEGYDSFASLKLTLEHQLEALGKPILIEKLENNQYKELDQEKQNEFSKSVENKEQIGEQDSNSSDGHTES